LQDRTRYEKKQKIGVYFPDIDQKMTLN